jgi:hypothetical protein
MFSPFVVEENRTKGVSLPKSMCFFLMTNVSRMFLFFLRRLNNTIFTLIILKRCELSRKDKYYKNVHALFVILLVVLRNTHNEIVET